MKELYIAPEAEIICFAPVEDLANDFWNSQVGGTSLFSSGNNTSPTIDEPIETNPDDGDLAPED